MNKLTFRKVWDAAWVEAIKQFADIYDPTDEAYIEHKCNEAFEAWFKKSQAEEI